MTTYVVQWNYKAGKVGPWFAGDTVDLSPAEAEAVNRDSPGVLALPKAAPARSLDAAPVDRMYKAPGRKRGAGLDTEG